MSKDFPTLEENIRFIQQEVLPEFIKSMSPEQIAQAVKKTDRLQIMRAWLEQVRSNDELTSLDAKEQVELQRLLNKLENGKRKR